MEIKKQKSGHRNFRKIIIFIFKIAQKNKILTNQTKKCKRQDGKISLLEL